MTARRLRLEQVTIDLRSGWRERLLRQLSQELGDPELAEQAALAIAGKVSAEVARAQRRRGPAAPTEGRR